MSVSAGDTTTATLTLTPLSGFTGPVRAVCQTPVSYIACTVALPTTISAPLAIPVNIAVSRTSTALSFPSLGGIATVSTLALLLPILTLRSRHRTAFRGLALLSALFALSLVLSGCAQGGNFAQVPPGSQTLTVAITAAGTTIPATLTINITD